MEVCIKKGRASGKVTIPGSKSIAHRMLILAALSPAETFIENVPANNDIFATVSCLRELGAEINLENNVAAVKGVDTDIFSSVNKFFIFNCGESGSTLRFMLPIALVIGLTCEFRGSKRLFERPLSVYEDICKNNDITWILGENSLRLSGKLYGGRFQFPGDISSQFVTGLMLALPFAEETSEIILTEKVESYPYIRTTMDVMKVFGLKIGQKNKSNYWVPELQKITSKGVMSVPTDCSNAAFFEALNLLGGNVILPEIDEGIYQGDLIYRDIFPKIRENNLCVDIADTPDLAPVLMVLGALNNGITLKNTHRLKFKESDRGRAMQTELSKAGATVELYDNEIVVHGGISPDGEIVFDSHNDHRIAMALAVFATVTGGKIAGAEAVRKSFPEFFGQLIIDN